MASEGIFTTKELYRWIRGCLHPDRVQDPDTKQLYTKYFHQFEKLPFTEAEPVNTDGRPNMTAEQWAQAATILGGELSGFASTMKMFRRWDEDDERRKTIDRIRATIKVRHPLLRFDVWRIRPRSMRHWAVSWTNGPPETEIKDIVAPFARKDLTFVYERKIEVPR